MATTRDMRLKEGPIYRYILHPREKRAQILRNEMTIATLHDFNYERLVKQVKLMTYAYQMFRLMKRVAKVDHMPFEGEVFKDIEELIAKIESKT